MKNESDNFWLTEQMFSITGGGAHFEASLERCPYWLSVDCMEQHLGPSNSDGKSHLCLSTCT